MILRKWQERERKYNHEPRALINAEMRLGKSLSAILWLQDNLFDRVLIIAPVTPCPQWIDFLGVYGLINTYNIVKLYDRNPKQMMALIGPGNRKRTGRTIYVISESKIATHIDSLLALRCDAMVWDESHHGKSPSSARGRAARRLAWSTPNVRLLTGTPSPNGPQDLWGQFTCIDKELWGSSYEKYKNKHLIVDNYAYEKVVGTRNPKKLQAMVSQCSRVYTREEEFGEDNWAVTNKYLDLPPNVRRMYNSLVKDWCLERETSGVALSAMHTLSRMKRLQQLTSGYLPDEDGENKLIHTTKLDAVEDDINEIFEAKEKVVLFHQFTWEGEQIRRRFEKTKTPVFSISGNVSPNEREKRIAEFTQHNGPALFIIQTRAGGTGISLAVATHCLFISRGFSFSDELQARDRVFMPGKSRCVTYYVVINTIDRYIDSVLTDKQDFHTAVAKSSIDRIAYGDEFSVEKWDGT